MNESNFLTPVRMMAEEFGWTTLYDSGPADGRRVTYAKGHYDLEVNFDVNGRITKAVKTDYGKDADVAHAYLHGSLPQGRAVNTQTSGHSGPAELLMLTLRMLEGSF